MASTYVPQKLKCPVGGKSFKYMALASITHWGRLPDGMPLGSGIFPTPPPKCPDNALVMYRDFTSAEIKSLNAFVNSDGYRALITSSETTYYLAWRTAKHLGDADAVWLLLQASWEAKNIDPESERAKRYNSEFAEAASQAPKTPVSFEAIALQMRRANALRELGRFEAAEAARIAISIPDSLGGNEEDANANRKGWRDTIAALGAVIARRDPSRTPIDMMGSREAASRCLEAEFAKKQKMSPPPPLTAFEQGWCARPELAEDLNRLREYLAN